jgi:hypothetical protein
MKIRGAAGGTRRIPAIAAGVDLGLDKLGSTCRKMLSPNYLLSTLTLSPKTLRRIDATRMLSLLYKLLKFRALEMTCCQSADMNRGRGGVGADLTPLDAKLCSQFAVCASARSSVHKSFHVSTARDADDFIHYRNLLCSAVICNRNSSHTPPASHFSLWINKFLQFLHKFNQHFFICNNFKPQRKVASSIL